MAYFLTYGNFPTAKHLVITTSQDTSPITTWIEVTGSAEAVTLRHDSDNRNFHEPIIKTSLEVEFLKNNAIAESLFDAILNDNDNNVWAYATTGERMNANYTLPSGTILEFQGSLSLESWVERFSRITPVRFVFTDRIGLLEKPFIPITNYVSVTSLLTDCLQGISSQHYLAIEWPYIDGANTAPHQFLIDVTTCVGKTTTEVLEDVLDSFGLQMYVEFHTSFGNLAVNRTGCVRIRSQFLHGDSILRQWLYELNPRYVPVTSRPWVTYETPGGTATVQVQANGYFEEFKLEVNLQPLLIHNNTEFEYDFKAKKVTSINKYESSPNLIFPEISEHYFTPNTHFIAGIGLLNEYIAMFTHEAGPVAESVWNAEIMNRILGLAPRVHSWGHVVGAQRKHGILLKIQPMGTRHRSYIMPAVVKHQSGTIKIVLQLYMLTGVNIPIFIQPCCITAAGVLLKYDVASATWLNNALFPASSFVHLIPTSGYTTREITFAQPPLAGQMYRLYFTMYQENRPPSYVFLTGITANIVPDISGLPTGVSIQTTINENNRQDIVSEHVFYNLPNLPNAESVIKNGIYNTSFVPIFATDFIGIPGTMLSHVNWQKVVFYSYNRKLLKGNYRRNMTSLKHIFMLEEKPFMLAESICDMKRGEVEFSMIEIPFAPLLAPGIVWASEIMNTAFRANWSRIFIATRYRVDVSLNSGFTTFISGWNNTDVGNVLSVIIGSLTANTVYFFRVRAENARTVSGQSMTVQVQTLAAEQPPANPANVTLSNNGDGTINVEWTASAGATRYEVRHNVNGGAYGAWVDVGNVLSTILGTWGDGTTICVQVRACNISGCSVGTPETCVVIVIGDPF